jgi:hypothetical protein
VNRLHIQKIQNEVVMQPRERETNKPAEKRKAGPEDLRGEDAAKRARTDDDASETSDAVRAAAAALAAAVAATNGFTRGAAASAAAGYNVSAAAAYTPSAAPAALHFNTVSNMAQESAPETPKQRKSIRFSQKNLLQIVKKRDHDIARSELKDILEKIPPKPRDSKETTKEHFLHALMGSNLEAGTACVISDSSPMYRIIHSKRWDLLDIVIDALSRHYPLNEAQSFAQQKALWAHDIFCMSVGQNFSTTRLCAYSHRYKIDINQPSLLAKNHLPLEFMSTRSENWISRAGRLLRDFPRHEAKTAAVATWMRRSAFDAIAHSPYEQANALSKLLVETLLPYLRNEDIPSLYTSGIQLQLPGFVQTLRTLTKSSKISTQDENHAPEKTLVGTLELGLPNEFLEIKTHIIKTQGEKVFNLLLVNYQRALTIRDHLTDKPHKFDMPLEKIALFNMLPPNKDLFFSTLNLCSFGQLKHEKEALDLMSDLAKKMDVYLSASTFTEEEYLRMMRILLDGPDSDTAAKLFSSLINPCSNPDRIENFLPRVINHLVRAFSSFYNCEEKTDFIKKAMISVTNKGISFTNTVTTLAMMLYMNQITAETNPRIFKFWQEDVFDSKEIKNFAYCLENARPTDAKDTPTVLRNILYLVIAMDGSKSLPNNLSSTTAACAFKLYYIKLLEKALAAEMNHDMNSPILRVNLVRLLLAGKKPIDHILPIIEYLMEKAPLAQLEFRHDGLTIFEIVAEYHRQHQTSQLYAMEFRYFIENFRDRMLATQEQMLRRAQALKKDILGIRPIANNTQNTHSVAMHTTTALSAARLDEQHYHPACLGDLSPKKHEHNTLQACQNHFSIELMQTMQLALQEKCRAQYKLPEDVIHSITSYYSSELSLAIPDALPRLPTEVSLFSRTPKYIFCHVRNYFIETLNTSADIKKSLSADFTELFEKGRETFSRHLEYYVLYLAQVILGIDGYRDYVEPGSGISLRRAFSLVWSAMNDSRYFKTDKDRADIYKTFGQQCKQILTEYQSIDPDAALACNAGTFNQIIATLDKMHNDVRLLHLSGENLDLLISRFAQETFDAMPVTSQAALAREAQRALEAEDNGYYFTAKDEPLLNQFKQSLDLACTTFITHEYNAVQNKDEDKSPNPTIQKLVAQLHHGRDTLIKSTREKWIGTLRHDGIISLRLERDLIAFFEKKYSALTPADKKPFVDAHKMQSNLEKENSTLVTHFIRQHWKEFSSYALKDLKDQDDTTAYAITKLNTEIKEKAGQYQTEQLDALKEKHKALLQDAKQKDTELQKIQQLAKEAGLKKEAELKQAKQDYFDNLQRRDSKTKYMIQEFQKRLDERLSNKPFPTLLFQTISAEFKAAEGQASWSPRLHQPATADIAPAQLDSFPLKERDTKMQPRA